MSYHPSPTKHHSLRSTKYPCSRSQNYCYVRTFQPDRQPLTPFVFIKPEKYPSIKGFCRIPSNSKCKVYGKPNTQFLPVRFAHSTVSIRNNRRWFWASTERSSTKDEVGHFQLGCDFKVEPHRVSCALHQLKCKYATLIFYTILLVRKVSLKT